ncbi:hypothetical protein OQA88_5307 [Cercophora sp. LCS_1]
MNEVYASSRRTIAYLGPSEGFETREALIAHWDYVRALAGWEPPVDGTWVEWHPTNGVVAAQAVGEKGQSRPDTFRFKTTASLPDETVINGQDFLFAPVTIRNAWVWFFTRPWFTRAWTTQEFVAAPDVTLRVGCEDVMCGFKELDEFENYLFLFDRFEGLSDPANRCIMGILSITCVGKLHLMSTLRRDRDIAIHTAIGLGGEIESHSSYMLLAAEDPRDRLWSILGMTRDRTKPLLQPDYSLDATEVYLRFSIDAAVNGMLSELLDSTRPASDTVPSWLLDAGGARQRRQYCFRTQDTQPWADKPDFRLDLTGLELGITVVLADKVEWVSEHLPPAKDTYSNYDLSGLDTHLDAVLRSIDEATESRFFHDPCEPRSKAIWHFLHGGGLNLQNEKYWADWDQWIRPWIKTVTLFNDFNGQMGREQPIRTQFRAGELEQLLISPLFEKIRVDGWPIDLLTMHPGIWSPPKSGKSTLDSVLEDFHGLSTAIWLFMGPSAAHCWYTRRFGRGEKGYLCNLDPAAQPGDYIALSVARDALVLRKVEESFRIVGHVYAYGLLDGIRVFGSQREKIWLR